jgi:hypothetical protein
MDRTHLLAISLLTGSVAVGFGLLPSAHALVPLLVDILRPFIAQAFACLSLLMTEALLWLVLSLLHFFGSLVPPMINLGRWPYVVYAFRASRCAAGGILRMLVSKTLLGLFMDLLVSWDCIARPSAGLKDFMCAIWPWPWPWPWLAGSILVCPALVGPDPLCVYVMPAFRLALDADTNITTNWVGGITLVRAALQFYNMRSGARGAIIAKESKHF